MHAVVRSKSALHGPALSERRYFANYHLTYSDLVQVLPLSSSVADPVDSAAAVVVAVLQFFPCGVAEQPRPATMAGRLDGFQRPHFAWTKFARSQVA